MINYFIKLWVYFKIKRTIKQVNKNNDIRNKINIKSLHVTIKDIL